MKREEQETARPEARARRDRSETPRQPVTSRYCSARHLSNKSPTLSSLTLQPPASTLYVHNRFEVWCGGQQRMRVWKGGTKGP
jgi:hypothetical protein